MIQKIGANTRIKAVINRQENKHRQYLYNEVFKFIKEQKIGASFKTNEIEIPSVQYSALNKLKALGIKITEKQ